MYGEHTTHRKFSQQFKISVSEPRFLFFLSPFEERRVYLIESLYRVPLWGLVVFFLAPHSCSQLTCPFYYALHRYPLLCSDVWYVMLSVDLILGLSKLFLIVFALVCLLEETKKKKKKASWRN